MQKAYTLKTDLDMAYQRCKDLMLIEDKLYFTRYDCFDENLGPKVYQCDVKSGRTKALKTQKESFKEIHRMTYVHKNKLLIASKGFDEKYWLNVCILTKGEISIIQKF